MANDEYRTVRLSPELDDRLEEIVPEHDVVRLKGKGKVSARVHWALEKFLGLYPPDDGSRTRSVTE